FEYGTIWAHCAFHFARGAKSSGASNQRWREINESESESESEARPAAARWAAGWPTGWSAEARPAAARWSAGWPAGRSAEARPAAAGWSTGWPAEPLSEEKDQESPAPEAGLFHLATARASCFASQVEYAWSMGTVSALPLFHLYGDPPDDSAFDFI